jgi:V/A-type H+-transporting ATPase subunit F
MSEATLAILVRAPHGAGFRLAGASVYEIPEHDAGPRLAALAEDRRLGILAVSEELLPHLPGALLRRAAREGLPIIVPFSIPRAWTEETRAEEYVGALLRRAIGYRVKIVR